jgi:ABC-type phosphate transport system auxiliary subunit
MEVAGSLGDFATTNQCSVGNLKEQLKQKDLLVRQLQNQIKTVEQSVRNEMNKGFEQIRACDRQEIQQLKISLDEMHKNSQASRELAIQQGELVKQLQAKINLTEEHDSGYGSFPSPGIGGAREAGISPTKPFY